MTSTIDDVKGFSKKLRESYGAIYNQSFNVTGKSEGGEHINALYEAIGRYDKRDIDELARQLTTGELKKYLDKPPRMPAMLNMLAEIHDKFAKHKGIKHKIQHSDAFRDAKRKNEQALIASNLAGDLEYSNKIIKAMNNNDVKAMHGSNVYEVMYQKHQTKQLRYEQIKEIKEQWRKK